MLKKLVITALAVLIVTSTVALNGQAPVTEKLVAGTVIVYARSPQIWRVKVDPKTMGNVTVSGHFAVTDGTPKNIDVLVFNQQNYDMWNDETEKANAKPIASVIRKGEGDINARLTDAGYHFLVISDRFEYEGKKTISADIKVQYDKR